jgi:AmmeMemoRadiSam system protein A
LRKDVVENHFHPLVALARKAIENYVRYKETVPPPQTLTEEMKEKKGVFVSLKKKGSLRGCIGTYSPTKPNVAEEIIQNAIHAATMDPRFSPVSEDELDQITVSVDVLSESEKIENKSLLDHKRYGIIVSSGGRKGLLLPDIEGVNSVDEQISIARRKAGIGRDEPVQLMRFEVKRYK